MQIRIAILASILALIYVGFSSAYPFYFSWDMDWTTTLDLLLIQSKMLPDHTNHPGLGMYFLFTWVHKLGFYLGQVSFLNLDSVKKAGNPFYGIAELISFLRNISVWVSLGIAFCLPVILLKMTARKAGSGLSTALLALFAVQEGLIFSLFVIRSELYSMLFLVLGIFWFLSARERNLSVRVQYLGLGVLFSLGFFTKMQCLVLIPWFLVMLVFSSHVHLRSLFYRHKQVVISPLSLILPGLVSALLFVARIHPSVEGSTVGVSSFALNWAGYALLALFFAPLYLRLYRRKSSEAIEWFLLGTCLALCAPFLMYLNPERGMDYLLTLLKQVFWRTLYQSSESLTAPSILIRITQELKYAPLLYFTHLAVVIGVGLKLKKEKARIRVLLGAEALLFAHCLICARYLPRDILWKELPVLFATLVFALQYFSNRFQYLWTILGLLLVGQLHGVTLIQKRTDALYAENGWDLKRMGSSVYSGHHKEYEQIISEKITNSGASKEDGIELSRSFSQSKNLLRTVFINADVDFTGASSVLTHYKVRVDEKLVQFPPELKGGILIPTDDLVPLSYRFNSSAMRILTEDQDKRIEQPHPRVLSVSPRRDASLWFFSKGEAIPKTNFTLYELEHAQITTESGDIRTLYRGHKLDRYVEFAVDEVFRSGFFVLK